MRTPRPRIGLPLGMVLVAILASAGVVYATTGSGITTTQIVQGNFGDINVKTNFDGHKVDIDTKGDSDLYVVSNVIAARRAHRLAHPSGPEPDHRQERHDHGLRGRRPDLHAHRVHGGRGLRRPG